MYDKKFHSRLTHNLRSSIFLLTLVCLAIASPARGTQVGTIIARLQLALLVKPNVKAQYANNPLVDIVHLQFRWSDVEPTKHGNYQFGPLVTEIKFWAAQGKKVMLDVILYGQDNEVDSCPSMLSPAKARKLLNKESITPWWVFSPHSDISSVCFAGGGVAAGKDIFVPIVWTESFYEGYLDPLLTALSQTLNQNPEAKAAVAFIQPSFGHLGNITAQPSKEGGPVFVANGWTTELWKTHCLAVFNRYGQSFPEIPLIGIDEGILIRHSDAVTPSCMGSDCSPDTDYIKESSDISQTLVRAGMSLIHFNVRPDKLAPLTVPQYFSSYLQSLFPTLMPVIQKFGSAPRLGLGDDWPWWAPANQRSGSTQGHDETFYRAALNAIFGNSAHPLPTSLYYANPPEIEASSPNSPAYNPVVFETLEKARRRLSSDFGGGAEILGSGKTTYAIGVGFPHYTQVNEEALIAAEEAGFKAVRLNFDWQTTDTGDTGDSAAARYQFQGYHDVIAGLRSHGLVPYFILGYRNSHYSGETNGVIDSPVDELSRTAFTNWVVAAMKEFKNAGAIWELYNEPNRCFWLPQPAVDQYASLAQQVVSAVKDPSNGVQDQILIAPAVSKDDFPDFRYLTNLSQRPFFKEFSAISVHPYRQPASPLIFPPTIVTESNGCVEPPRPSTDIVTREPETFSEDLGSLAKVLSRNSVSLPIVAGEWAYSTGGYQQLTPHQQAEYAVRMWLTTSMSHVPLVVWYILDQETGSRRSQGFSLLEAQGTKRKPAFYAIKNLLKILDGFNYQTSLVASPNDYALQFEDALKNIRLVAWTTAVQGHDISITTLPNTKFLVVGMDGQRQSNITSDSSGALTIRITGSPVYLLPAGSDPK